MTFGKRIFDIVFGLLLGLLLAIPMAAIAVLIAVRDGRPVIYASERMRTPQGGFTLYKFRTMRPDGVNHGVSGGDKHQRISRLGAWLRRTRLDELPQLWNILKGDISFVGPRPPLRQYVDRCPEVYAKVLQSRPGVTGLASLHCHRAEERLLSRCRTAEETDRIYVRHCIPRKARLDLIYQQNRSLCMDVWIIWRTIRSVFRRDGRGRVHAK